MDGFQNLKQQLLPLFKGLPLVVGIFLVFLFAAKKIVSYSPNVYQTIAKIKLDDQKHGMSNNNLFGDFDVFSMENKIIAEAEVLKSPLLIQKALDSISLDVIIYRKGRLKNTMLYDDSPISVTYEAMNNDFYNSNLNIHFTNETSFEVSVGEEDNSEKITASFDTKILLPNGNIIVTKNEEIIKARSLELIADYEINILSEQQLVNYISQKLDVKAVDKEMPILRIVFKEQHPQKAADFTNVLCQTYLQDYITAKSNAANLTVKFIDEKLKEIGRKLKSSELNLEKFKQNNGVVNTTQETETGLREISKLKIQLINLESSEIAIKQVLFSIDKEKTLDLSAVKFGFGDLLMTELVKKYKNLQDAREEALLKFTSDSEEVRLIDGKILDLKDYLKQAIKQNLIDIEIQRGYLELQVLESSRMFDELPTREKNHQILEREFHLQEEVYNFLSQKKIEASIAASAMITFHRIIQRAEVPSKPTSPNKVLITFVMGLLGLIIGISFIFLKRSARGKVFAKSDIEKLTTLPVLNVIRKSNKGHDFEQLSKAILLKKLVSKNQVISVNSTLNDEGKTYVSKYLAETMAGLDFSVCLLNINRKTVALPKPINGVVTNYSLAKFDNKIINTLKETFDFVIIDSVSTSIDITGVEAMAAADLNLYLIRANQTHQNYVSYPEILKEEYDLKNLFLILNDAHSATNYSGNFIGSKFQQANKPKGLVSRVKYYYQTYIA
ncbi:MAG: exopolysaccharide transport family protein [Crocinitomicaceae bacterium]